ncbi:hypothetical protein KIL84_018688 [Mauremys mutica]|uniref:Uncharacterized protein n=1 Tax=Mauremys mutica TaxID=74926 RepID=A0A9D4BAH9_9SAUR|nr:hypothetical protein KIL84_018688 [Mauremys mutica]
MAGGGSRRSRCPSLSLAPPGPTIPCTQIHTHTVHATQSQPTCTRRESFTCLPLAAAAEGQKEGATETAASHTRDFIPGFTSAWLRSPSILIRNPLALSSLPRPPAPESLSGQASPESPEQRRSQAGGERAGVELPGSPHETWRS